MIKIYCVLAVLLVTGGYYMNEQYNDAMAKCQVKFSYDTCFHSLNR